MIEALKFNKEVNNDLVDFINKGKRLYITHDNKRQAIKTLNDLKLLYKESAFAIRKVDKGCTRAVLFVWKSNSFNVTRNYIKIEYENIVDVDDVLMVLNWNFNKEVYVKLDKNSPLIDSFRKKGFKKCYDNRGNEILLCRSKNDKRFIPPYKEGDLDE